MNQRQFLEAYLQRSAQTVVYLLALVALLLLSGWLMLGTLGVLLMFGLATAALTLGRQLPVSVLMRMRRARPLHPGEARLLLQMVNGLAARAGLRRAPALYAVQSSEMQAFAVDSGGQTAIGITPALVRALRTSELRAVLAHEISHLASGDTKVMSAATAMRGLTRSLASLALLLAALSILGLSTFAISLGAMLLLMLAPTLSYLAELGLSRTREFSADLAAARITGQPEALASALAKLEYQQQGLLARLLGQVPALQVPEALRTHPATAERIQRLLELRLEAPATLPYHHGVESPRPSFGPLRARSAQSALRAVL